THANSMVAYVTGGGQGIGRAFAHALGEAGAKVVVVDLVLAKAEAVAYELSLKGKQCIYLQVAAVHESVMSAVTVWLLSLFKARSFLLAVIIFQQGLMENKSEQRISK
uniref:Uncharacterized protein n=1 Tax=Dromaius novaehollandiae TaxID=8790 RepID=A0A8C4K3C5_DRONO